MRAKRLAFSLYPRKSDAFCPHRVPKAGRKPGAFNLLSQISEVQLLLVGKL